MEIHDFCSCQLRRYSWWKNTPETCGGQISAGYVYDYFESFWDPIPKAFVYSKPIEVFYSKPYNKCEGGGGYNYIAIAEKDHFKETDLLEIDDVKESGTFLQ